MASKKCQHCGYYPVHREASICPRCGGPAPGQGLTLIGALLGLALLVGGIYWVANNKAALPHPGQTNAAEKNTKCVLTLTSPTAAPQNMKSEIFIDGVLVGEWPPGGRQVQLTVNQGARNIRIMAGGKILVFHRVVNVVGATMEYTLP